VATTLREVHSTNHHSWRAVACIDGQTYIVRPPASGACVCRERTGTDSAVSLRIGNNERVTDAIVKDPQVTHVPVFCGTRVPVQTLFESLAGGDTLEKFLLGFPPFHARWPWKRSPKPASCCWRAPHEASG